MLNKENQKKKISKKIKSDNLFYSSGTEVEYFDWINEELLEKYLLYPLHKWKEYINELLNEQKLVVHIKIQLQMCLKILYLKKKIHLLKQINMKSLINTIIIFN